MNEWDSSRMHGIVDLDLHDEEDPDDEENKDLGVVNIFD